MRFVKGFNLGGSQLSLYLDARNILNFTNVLTQYVVTNSITSAIEQTQNFTADSSRNAQEGLSNGVYGEDGSMDLTFGGAGASGCGYVGQLVQRSVGAELHLPDPCGAALRQRGRHLHGGRAAERVERAVLREPGRTDLSSTGPGTQLRLGVEFTF